MKQFLIGEDQLQFVANTLLEFPAKQSLAAIDIIRKISSSPYQPPVAEKVNAQSASSHDDKGKPDNK